MDRGTTSAGRRLATGSYILTPAVDLLNENPTLSLSGTSSAPPHPLKSHFTEYILLRGWTAARPRMDRGTTAAGRRLQTGSYILTPAVDLLNENPTLSLSGKKLPIAQAGYKCRVH